MDIATIILLTVAGIVLLLLVTAMFMKKQHYVNREITIDAPAQTVFAFLRKLKNQEKFNKWAKAGADRIEDHRGTDGTVGYIYAWTGNKKVGQGEKEIKAIVDGKRIETEIRFVKPMKISATVIMEIEALSDHRTKVNLINCGLLKYPLNIMIPLAEKNFAKDMDSSLLTLKKLMEDAQSSVESTSAVTNTPA